jgi:adenylate cyclase
LRRGDARVLLVSLAFLASAGFLGLHALATPGVLLQTANAGFVVATPVGIALGSVLAVMSSVDLSGSRAVRVMRLGRELRALLLVVMAAWAVASLAQLPPLHQEAVPERADGILAAIAGWCYTASAPSGIGGCGGSYHR